MDQSVFHGHTLPADTCLNGTYLVKDVLGIGGFGITYSGVHKNTGDLVAIKEYFPSNLAVRTEQQGMFSLRPFPEKNADIFEKGRIRFLKEAHILKSLQNLNGIVTVYDLFEENGTAYLIMEYIDGLTLSQYIKENGTLAFPEISELIIPVIQSLAQIHEKGLIHRDISPDNLILGIDNKLHLIDFGAASWESSANIQNTIILKAGYAPPEQYTANSSIGAWIDIYAVCATMYFALTGTAPAEAILRLDQTSGETFPALANLLPWQRAILVKGLQLRPADRFRDMPELYFAMIATTKSNNSVTVRAVKLSAQHKQKIKKLRRSYSGKWLPASLAFLCVALIALVIFWAPRHLESAEKQRPAAPAVPSSAASPALSEEVMYQEETAIQEVSPIEPTAIASQLLVVPDLTGKTLDTARKQLKKLDTAIQIKTKYTYSNKMTPGKIISQSVAKGSYFSKGRLPSISLTISKGRKPVSSTAPPVKPTKNSDYKVKGEDSYVSIPLE